MYYVGKERWTSGEGGDWYPVEQQHQYVATQCMVYISDSFQCYLIIYLSYLYEIWLGANIHILILHHDMSNRTIIYILFSNRRVMREGCWVRGRGKGKYIFFVVVTTRIHLVTKTWCIAFFSLSLFGGTFVVRVPSTSPKFRYLN